ncbi:hypothetical protein [Levilactobacillus enshiensis]|uniref:hypothetical protein n=1 Tax=Levilactobacillus enshiensis TaxID=2590213 RepID=UPI00117BA9F0|nr:hypothetical protein [Levilactobacillus enshiensis]
MKFTRQRLRLFQVLGWLLLVTTWVVQVLGLSWRTLQPVRSLRTLIIFTLLALFWVLITVILKQSRWQQRQAFLLDLTIMCDLLVGLLLVLPRALGAVALANPVGRGGLICWSVTLLIAYCPPAAVHVPLGLKGKYALIQRLLVTEARVLLIISLVLLVLGAD